MSNIFSQIQQSVASNNAASLSAADRANAFTAEQANIARAYNAQEAAKARDWSERMSNTSYQRQIEDLKAAGLNPVLGYMKGSGASTPTAAQASTSIPGSAMAQTDFGGTSATTQAYNSNVQKEIAQDQITANKLISDLDRALKGQISSNELRTQMDIANSQVAASLRNADLHASTSIKAAEMQTAAQTVVASIAAAASRYGSDNSKEAALITSAISAAVSKYASDKNYSATQLRTETDKILATLGFEHSKALKKIDFDYLMDQLEKYPNSMWQSDEFRAWLIQSGEVASSPVLKDAASITATADAFSSEIGAESQARSNSSDSKYYKASGNFFEDLFNIFKPGNAFSDWLLGID